ncbi:MAG: hypothetical protein JO280_08985, partial [Mycobacteriaceae bacterium]|nr:hypothetical protein [Mycobacteriaceae bacterium]
TELLAQDPQQPADDGQITVEAEALIESVFATTEVAPSAPTLITEQEVMFSTAAAVPARRQRWWTRRGASAAKPTDSAPKRRHYPARMDYLEHSRMAREMHRL